VAEGAGAVCRDPSVMPDAAMSGTDAGPRDSSASADASFRGDGGPATVDGGMGHSGRALSGGCACTVGAARGSRGALLFSLALLGLAVRRRRSR